MMKPLILSLFYLLLFQINLHYIIGQSTEIVFPEHEYNFLKEIYENTNGPEWFDNTNWNFSNRTLYNPCLQNWYGLLVQCAPEGQSGVIAMYLGSNNLVGRFVQTVSNMTYLETIDIENNHVFGA